MQSLLHVYYCYHNAEGAVRLQLVISKGRNIVIKIGGLVLCIAVVTLPHTYLHFMYVVYSMLCIVCK